MTVYRAGLIGARKFLDCTIEYLVWQPIALEYGS